MPLLNGALLALALRHLHWLALMLALCSTLVWIWRHAAPQTNAASSSGRIRYAAIAAAGLFIAAGCAFAWPAAYVIYAWPEAATAQTLAALVLSSHGAWFPEWQTLWTLHPPWPLAWRPEPDIPASAHALKQLHQSAGLLAVSFLLLLSCFWLQRHWKWAAFLAASTLILILPRPRPELLLSSATPATFLQPPESFHAQSILAGRQLYRQHCAQCHGIHADGQGPIASAQASWPSTLGSALFRHRHAGDLYWNILRGMNDRHGRETMQAFQGILSGQEIWHTLDYLRALSAGQEARAEKGWKQALPAPDFPLECERNHSRSLRDLNGRLIHLVAFTDAIRADTIFIPDPRLTTIALTAENGTMDSLPPGIDCIARSPAAVYAYAIIAGMQDDPSPASLNGLQFLLDRGNWLRTRALPGNSADWSAADSMCGPDIPPSTAGGGLDSLLRTIESAAVDAPRFRNRITFHSQP